MKNYKYLMAVGLMYLTGSCSEDFLDTTPMTSKTDVSYYTTAEEASDALVGCYDGLQRIYDGGVAMPVAADVLSDLCFGGTGATDADNIRMLDEFDKNVSSSDMNMFKQNWANLYSAIYRCNMLLTRMGQVKGWKTPEQKNEIEAQARFIRAYAYFDLIRMFGHIPLLTEPSIKNIPQSNPDLVYKLITEDLMFAVDNVNDLKYNQIAPADFGSVTSWAAEALLTRVYLYYTGYYGKDDLVCLVTKPMALVYVEDVIANSGHGLIPNFYDLWPAAATYQAAKNGKEIIDNTYAGETNKEVVFAIKYTYTSDWSGNVDGNSWLIMNGLRLTSSGKYGYGMGWGANTVLADVYNNWDPNDDRRDASIIAVEEEEINFTFESDTKEYMGYYTKKYTPTCDKKGNSMAEMAGGVSYMVSQFQDYFAIRYADVLLMAAELRSSNALDYVNQVRVRSHAVPVTTVNKDVIFEERRLELAFEGQRYWDLLRYDNTLAYAAQKVSFNGVVKNGGVDTPKIIDGANLVACKGLFQIPYDEITLSNGVLIQNTGW